MQVCEHGRGVGVIVLRVGFWVDRGCIFFWSSIHNMTVVFLSVSHIFFLFNVIRVRLFPNVIVCCVFLLKEKTKGTNFVFNRLNASVLHNLSLFILNV